MIKSTIRNMTNNVNNSTNGDSDWSYGDHRGHHNNEFATVLGRGGILVGKRLRICYISFMFAPAIGGAEARTEKQARQLQAQGHDVTIITLRCNKQWQRNELQAGLPVIRIGGLFKRNG